MLPNPLTRSFVLRVCVFASCLLGAAVVLWCTRGAHPGAHLDSRATVSRTLLGVAAEPTRTLSRMSGLPLAFEPNLGQTDAQVRYLARGAQYEVFLTHRAAVFAVTHPGSATKLHRGGPVRACNSAAVRLELMGANQKANVSARERADGYSNYIVGRDSEHWIREVPHYGRVNYASIYPGIDLTYYGQQGQLEFDFVLAPGAAPQQIVFGVDGAHSAKTNASGDLVLTTTAGDVVLHKPLAYQTRGDRREPVDAAFEFREDHQVAFALGPYDHARALVIDPSVTYSTYLGGGNKDLGLAIAADGAGSAYVAGQTLSAGFPKTIGSFTGTSVAFVTKFKADGSGLVYSTLIGGSGSTGDQSANAIAIDGNQNIYIAGGTSSTTFPVTSNAAQGTYHGDPFDAFVAKLDATGKLVYATYAGGGAEDIGLGVTVDSDGNIYAAGETLSSDFPLHVALQGGNAGDHDGFIVKIDHTTGLFDFASYLGGTASDQITGIGVDGARNIYVAGITVSTNFPTSAATGTPYQKQCGTDGNCNFGSSGAQSDAFVTAIKSDFSQYIYSTYLGGSKFDEAQALAVDSSGNAYIVGDTASPDLRTVNPYQSSLVSGAVSNGFVAELDPTGNTAKYLTYIGGNGQDAALGIALDSSAQNIYLTGQTNSSNFPMANSLQAIIGGAADAFVSQLKPSAGSGSSQLLFSTFVGGSADEDANGGAVAVDSQGNIYITGDTASSDFLTINPFQAKLATAPDAFVVKVNPAASTAAITLGAVTVSPSTISRGSKGTATVTVTSQNNFVGNVTLGCTIASTGSAAASPPTCSLNPATVALTANGSQQSTLTVFTKLTGATNPVPTALWLPVPAVAMLGAGLSRRGRRRSAFLGAAVWLLLACLLAMAGCGSSSGGGGGGGGGGGTTTGAYTITVTGTGLGVSASSAPANFSVQ
jgi:hypothetical protein